MDYYMFFLKYNECLLENVDNTIDLFGQLIKLVGNNAIQFNHLLMLLSLTYHDITLDARMKSKKVELLSKNTLISTFFTKYDNNLFVEDGVCVHLYMYDTIIVEKLPPFNIYSMIKMYEYLANKNLKFYN